MVSVTHNVIHYLETVCFNYLG